MPFRDPEQKRQWERAHRYERNAQRRLRRARPCALDPIGIANDTTPADPVKPPSTGMPWWAKALLLGGALMIGIPLLFPLPRLDR